MASQADLSTAADDKSASVSSVPASWSSRTKTKSKKCKKCGSMIQNLSCHQSNVHKMPMMKRKLDVYVTRKRKLPNQRIKFCPLAPRKSKKKPIFQLHKHLQTRIHKLKPGTPAYLNALSHAPPALFKKIESHLKNRKTVGRRNTVKVTRRLIGRMKITTHARKWGLNTAQRIVMNSKMRILKWTSHKGWWKSKESSLED